MSRRLLVFALLAVVACDEVSSSSSTTTVDTTSVDTTSVDTTSTGTEEPAPLCPENEEWKLCGRLCEPSCWNRDPTFCPPLACSINTTAGCRCEHGLVRNDQDECVKPDQCPNGYKKN